MHTKTYIFMLYTEIHEMLWMETDTKHTTGKPGQFAAQMRAST